MILSSTSTAFHVTKSEMKSDFLHTYWQTILFSGIEGYVTFDAALLFFAYNQLVSSAGITGDTLEIGVHHGLSAVAVAAMSGESKQFFGVDLFDDLQVNNTSGSGKGNLAAFWRTMGLFFDDLSFVRPLSTRSQELRAVDLGSDFVFCHIDGGHSAKEAFSDLSLCNELLKPGGLVALDDYFNPAFPGVAEGAVQFMGENREAFRPIAIGFNKVLWQKEPFDLDLNTNFAAAFPRISKATAVMFGEPVYLFNSSLRPCFDLEHSTVAKLAPTTEPFVRAILEPRAASLIATRGEVLTLPVRVINRSTEVFPFGEANFGLSYHLLSDRSEILKFDNPRCYFAHPLHPAEDVTVNLQVYAPDAAGAYFLEIDLVWENVTWFKETGNATAVVPLIISD
jgi:hypothetical protein